MHCVSKGHDSKCDNRLNIGPIHCVSKNGSDVAHYNFNANQLFGNFWHRDVAQRLCYRTVICYPTSPNYCLCITWEKVNPENYLFSDSGKLGIRREYPYRQIEMKFCIVGGLQEAVRSSKVRISSKSIKRFRTFCGVEICPLSLIWLIQNRNLAAN